ncbi:MAG TPA: hypothetical protein VGH98_21575 [Gemmatimonadaceae bacterium]
MAIRTNRGKVLILTPQPMTGALLGMLVELSQLEPVFADPNERPEDALARHVPLLVIVADGEVDTFRSDLFLARAEHRGIGVVVFGVTHRGDTGSWAQQRGLPYLELPTDAEMFGRILDQATRQDRRSRLAGDRRNSAYTERAVDGTLIFQAESGERWYVYDRRSGERRRIESSEAPYRAFVSQNGVELRVPLEPHEFGDKTPETLQRQLARAR